MLAAASMSGGSWIPEQPPEQAPGSEINDGLGRSWRRGLSATSCSGGQTPQRLTASSPPSVQPVAFDASRVQSFRRRSRKPARARSRSAVARPQGRARPTPTRLALSWRPHTLARFHLDVWPRARDPAACANRRHRSVRERPRPGHLARPRGGAGAPAPNSAVSEVTPDNASWRSSRKADSAITSADRSPAIDHRQAQPSAPRPHPSIAPHRVMLRML